jgi:hypothetical protein
MMHKKKFKILGISLLAGLAGVIALFVLPWIVLSVGLWLQPNPPGPEIKNGKFPFELVYEINGEKTVVKDTILCEFDGFGVDEGRGKYRKWKETLASGKEDIVLWRNNKGRTKQFLYYALPPASYLMGDGDKSDYDTDYNELYHNGTILFTGDSKDSSDESLIESKKLFTKYGIKIIAFEFAPPITNTFTQSLPNRIYEKILGRE